MKIVSSVLLVGGLIAMAAPVQAGWVVEWSNVVTKQDGQTLPAEPSTMQIEDNRVKLTQARSVMLIDYKKDSFTIINPATQSYWSGTLDQYMSEVSHKRALEMAKRSGRPPLPNQPKTPKNDESQLPPITVRKTDQTKTVAGHTVTKYEILSAGEPFQEMWVAEDINVSSDLDPDKFLAYQRKMSAGMQGNASPRYQALYRNEDYKKVVSKGFALDVRTKHPSGGFDRTVTAIRKEDIPESTFEIPESYHRVALADVLPQADNTAAENAQKPIVPPGAVKRPPSNPSGN